MQLFASLQGTISMFMLLWYPGSVSIVCVGGRTITRARCCQGRAEYRFTHKGCQGYPYYLLSSYGF